MRTPISAWFARVLSNLVVNSAVHVSDQRLELLRQDQQVQLMLKPQLKSNYFRHVSLNVSLLSSVVLKILRTDQYQWNTKLRSNNRTILELSFCFRKKKRISKYFSSRRNLLRIDNVTLHFVKFFCWPWIRFEMKNGFDLVRMIDHFHRSMLK